MKGGACLTSCHSFNVTDYEFNNGCSGYARDEVTFIAFTVDDPANPELLNNRKTSRQIFAYEPGNGVLLQSRMYNTAGGTYGAVEDSKLYRDLIQREISMLEGVPNLWRTGASTSSEYRDCIRTNSSFGGYADWTHSNFDGHVSIRVDCADIWHPIEIGEAGLCICCGDEISDGLYCDGCNHSHQKCECCGEYVGSEDDLYTVYDSDGDEMLVCEYCRDREFSQCDDCDNFFANDIVFEIEGRCVCNDCRDEYYDECEECGEWHSEDNMLYATDRYSNEVHICYDCCDNWFYACDNCGEYYHTSLVQPVYFKYGDIKTLCKNCAERYDECPECGERIEVRSDGTCPNCHAKIIAKEATAL